ncbi:YbdK family carboxylate-amine ligase [Microbacterium maritypicum]|uniref:Putative glutamate--cysteine ligase 2 n=1 Tax=Microbacterium maritypicum TaxID=33918 RepID=A0AAD3X3D6_MICMQ|nr:YbdK family carboxylate-amine ligase [Microbacterium liquefaciens]KAB1886317.1 YbdK family carboxylate-amine ligase [Microbacterium liquefaciens]
MPRFGIEEEFLFLDEHSLVPVALASGTRERITRLRTGGEVTTEYLTSQIECLTEPVASAMDAEAQLRHLRGLIGWHAREQHAIAAGTGTPFATTRSSTVSPSPHYDEVAEQLGHLTRDHEVNGLHVHVEVTDDEDRVRALDRVRGWLPVLLALTGNSPFVNGRDSSFASWRSILIRRLPSSWAPPRFRDYDEYRAGVQRLVDVGALADAASLSWSARISERYPTVEVRVFDAQLTAEDAVFAALLSRAIVLTDDQPLADIGVDGIDASLWTAARRGMGARLIDPTTGEIEDAWTVADRMRASIAPALRELGDEDRVWEGFERLRTLGTGADRQRRAVHDGGAPALAELLRAGTPAPFPASPPAAPRVTAPNP